jgi:hypothetical protein
LNLETARNFIAVRGDHSPLIPDDFMIGHPFFDIGLHGAPSASGVCLSRGKIAAILV